MRTNVTKVTAAYAISRTSQKVAYFGNEKIKTFFSFQTDFLKWQITYRHTYITCPGVYSRGSKRAKYVIPIHTNIITLKKKRLQYRLYSSKSGRGKTSSSAAECSNFTYSPPRLVLSLYGGIFLRLYRDQYMRLTTHCIAVQRSRISGTVPPLPQYVCLKMEPACSPETPEPSHQTTLRHNERYLFSKVWITY